MGMLATGTLIDQGVPTVRSLRLEKSARLISSGYESDHVIYTLPGCRTDGDWLASSLEPAVTTIDDSAVVEYSQRGFCLESVGDTIVEDYRQNPDRTMSFLDISMGGLTFVQLMRKHKTFREAFYGKIEAVLYDSSPSRYGYIKKPARRGLTVSSLVGNSSTALAISNRIIAGGANAHIETLEDIREAEAARPPHGRNGASFSAIRGQKGILKTVVVGDSPELEGVAKRSTYISSPGDMDHVVDTANSASDFKRAHAGQLDIVHDNDRPEGSHAAGPRFAENLIEYLRA